jgi:hypothetical protein
MVAMGDLLVGDRFARRAPIDIKKVEKSIDILISGSNRRRGVAH